jgi:hypothetical protein
MRQSCGALARGLSLWRPRDPELLHLVGECCPLEAQASCRSSGASHNPIVFAERSQRMAAYSSCSQGSFTVSLRLVPSRMTRRFLHRPFLRPYSISSRV